MKMRYPVSYTHLDVYKRQPRVSEISYDSDGTAIMNETSSGKNGYDLHLTIDVELQKKDVYKRQG